MRYYYSGRERGINSRRYFTQNGICREMSSGHSLDLVSVCCKKKKKKKCLVRNKGKREKSHKLNVAYK